MEKITQKDIEWLLNLGRKKHVKKRYALIGSDLRKKILKFCIALTGLFGLIILPFFLLIWMSVYLNLTHGFAGWAALGGGMIAAILLLITYILLLFRNIQNKKLLLKYSLAGVSTMGLPVNPASLHYKQHTGYVHAVDFRTNDRSYLRNALLGFSLQMMGFQTLNHKGTANHLHVELAVRQKRHR
jgi:hypothetical protein